MFCQKCGNQQPDNANFCGNCGALLKNDFQQISEEEVNANITQNTEFEQTKENNKEIVIEEEIKDDTETNDTKIENNSYKKYNIRNNIKNKGFSSPLGNLSLVWGIISILGMFLFLIIDSSYAFYKNFTIIFPVFIICGLILNIIAIYKDKKFKRSAIAFYLNFTTVTFMFMYFIYFVLIKFLV